jgi:hypothetical protein
VDPISIAVLALSVGAGVAGLIKRRRARKAKAALEAIRDVINVLPKK